MFDHMAEYEPAVARQLAGWVRAGDLALPGRRAALGLESSPDAIAGLYRGENSRQAPHRAAMA